MTPYIFGVYLLDDLNDLNQILQVNLFMICGFS